MKELREIQQQLKAPKGQFNSFGKYNYRSCEDILEAVKPLLAKTKCTLILSDEVKEIGSTYHIIASDDKKGTSMDYDGTRIYIEATATIINEAGESISTKAFAREEVVKAGMDASQITGAASSYARKYALNGLFCIDDQKDSDYTDTHGKANAAQPAQPAPNSLAAQKEQEWIDRASKCSTKNELLEFYKTAPEQLRKKGSNFWNYCNQRATELQ